MEFLVAAVPLAFEYLGLLAVSFMAATLLPAQSELLLAGMLVSGRYSVPLLLVVASVGNVLGSMANWVLGRFLRGSKGGAGSASTRSHRQSGAVVPSLRAVVAAFVLDAGDRRSLDGRRRSAARALADLLCAGHDRQVRPLPRDRLACGKLDVDFDDVHSASSPSRPARDLIRVCPGHRPQLSRNWKIGCYLRLGTTFRAARQTRYWLSNWVKN